MFSTHTSWGAHFKCAAHSWPARPSRPFFVLLSPARPPAEIATRRDVGRLSQCDFRSTFAVRTRPLTWSAALSRRLTAQSAKPPLHCSLADGFPPSTMGAKGYRSRRRQRVRRCPETVDVARRLVELAPVDALQEVRARAILSR